MLDDNFFANFFSNLSNNTEQLQIDLDGYWKSGKVKEYWELYYSNKDKYVITRDSNGKHIVKRRE